MRSKVNFDTELDFQPPRLKVTATYCEKYQRISAVLSAHPEILECAHEDLKKAQGRGEKKRGRRARCEFSSDTVLRVQICQVVEGLSLRETIARIDTSDFLRRFVRVYSKRMIDYSTFCKLRNAIQPKTWERINALLSEGAVRNDCISGAQLRLDTTAVETNIHWPTDSSLLWDSYRTFARLLTSAREFDRNIVGNGRLHSKRVKRYAIRIARLSGRKGKKARDLRTPYRKLIGAVEGILQWAADVEKALRDRLKRGVDGPVEAAHALAIADEIKHFVPLGSRVAAQATRRVLHGEQVPNDEKLFSIFEPHTELLKRGKAGKDVEFGHMVQIAQVEEKFITQYEVFEKKPIEHQLVSQALANHQQLFGRHPDSIAADKGYYQSAEALQALREVVPTVSIAKKGRRSPDEAELERDPFFRIAQRFRAGVEGTISFLKRTLGLFRCFTKGYQHYASTVGAAVFVHNLIVLSKS